MYNICYIEIIVGRQCKTYNIGIFVKSELNIEHQIKTLSQNVLFLNQKPILKKSVN